MVDGIYIPGRSDIWSDVAAGLDACIDMSRRGSKTRAKGDVIVDLVNMKECMAYTVHHVAGTVRFKLWCKYHLRLLGNPCNQY